MSRGRGKKKVGFGQSKHRKARVLRFSHRNKDSKKAFGGKDPGLREMVSEERARDRDAKHRPG